MHGAQRKSLPRCKLVEHQGAYEHDRPCVGDCAGAEWPDNRFLSILAPPNVIVGVVGDQADRSIHLGHDGVAGVDAEPTLDAAWLKAVADVDAGGTHGDALVAVDAIAGGKAGRPGADRLLERHSRLAAIITVSDV